jgi:hypothetical protein
MKVLENEFIKFWFEDGILCSAYKEPVDIDLEKAKETISLRHEISNNQKQFWCYDVAFLKSFSKDSRDYADKHGQEFLYACATIVNSHITKFMFNTFLKLKGSKIPMKVFTKRDVAMKWLLEMKTKNENQL